MDSFRAHFADTGIDDPAWQPRVAAQLRDRGLVTFSGIADRTALIAIAQRLMSIRPHRDAGPDGVTEITDVGASASGFAAFTDSGLILHTDGSAVADPPGLLLLTCVRPAEVGGATQVADGAAIIATLADKHPAALRSLSAPKAARFGGPSGFLGPVCERADVGRTRIRLRLDDLVRFSPDTAAVIPLLRTVISRHLETLHLGPGDTVLLCNTRWLHGRDAFDGHRVMLRILGDPLPGTGILPGFSAPGISGRRCPEIPDTDAGGLARWIA